jgi:hypothetical protein
MSVKPSLRAAATASSGAIPTYCTAWGGDGRLSWAMLPIIVPLANRRSGTLWRGVEAC